MRSIKIISQKNMQVKNLIGQRFGKLIVIERAENTKEGRAQWLCKCDCGNTKIINGKYLLNGDTKSCGCLNRTEPIIKEIAIGTVVGKLTVISSADKTKKGLPQWLCQCKCGNTKIIPETSLKNKRVMSCGCSKKASGIKIGDVFGRLTVIDFFDLTKQKNKRYLCQCECGKEKIVVGSKLIEGKTVSCGCIRWTKNKEIKEGDTFGKLTVIKRDKDKFTGKDKHIVKTWICKCRCGKIKTFSERALLNRDARSCGCAKYNQKIKQIKKGCHFGYLTVIKDLGMIEKQYKNKTKKEHYCLCQCDCGNIKEINLRNLKSGYTKTCGRCKIYKCKDKKSKKIEVNYQYKKSGITRIRKIFQNNEFELPRIDDPFYKDYVFEHENYEMFMIRQLNDTVKELISIFIKIKEFIIDVFLVAHSNSDIIYFNIMLSKNYNLNKDNFILPKKRNTFSYTNHFLSGMMGNYCDFCNIISYPICFKPVEKLIV